MQLNVDQVVTQKLPAFIAKPAPLRHSTLFCLRHLVREREINHVLAEHYGSMDFELFDRVLDDFNFSQALSRQHRMNIPTTGRVLIVATHPLGALDGLVLVDLDDLKPRKRER